MKKSLFNKGWTVETGDGSALSVLFSGGASRPEQVTLPHDRMVEVPRDPKEPHGPGIGFFHAEDLAYKNTLTLDENIRGKRVWLEFEGVYQNATVYVNDIFAGKCAYGYSNFYMDITRLVKPGQGNAVKVVVKNGVPSGRWYTGGGIYRNVNLMICDSVHIAPDGVFLQPVDVEEDLASLSVRIDTANEEMRTRSVYLKVSLYDADGAEVAANRMTATLGEAEQGTYRLPLYVKNPHLWDENDPYLYTYQASIMEGETVLDEECGTFGIRRLQLDPVHGLRVNGKTVKLRGGCIHHDNGVIGTKEFPFAAAERVRTLKEAGFNAIRSAHYPMSRQLLEACDRYGMYVMDEFSDVWTNSKVPYDYSMHMTEWWEHDIANMVRKDRNHPCVIMYSIGNEIPECGNAAAMGWGRKFTEKIRELDPTRYTINSMNMMMAYIETIARQANGGDDGAPLEINTVMNAMRDNMDAFMRDPKLAALTEEAAEQVDIIGYNYAAGRYEPEGTENPSHIICGSETTSPDLDKNWALVEKLPYVIGDFDWTAWDYLGEAGVGNITYAEKEGQTGPLMAGYPFKAAYSGDINLTGTRRPVSYWREIIWGRRTDPYIAVQPPQHYGEGKVISQWGFSDAIRSWTFEGFAGKGIVVEVYGDADEVELIVNGRSVGRKAPGEKKRALTLFDTVYEPGKVEAVLYKDGKAVGRDELLTAGAPAKLEAQVKCAGGALPADGTDIGYIDISVVDADGVLNMDKVLPVTVLVEGPAVLAGYGSASPCNEENYFDTTANTYEGRIRAAVRACGEGTVRVTFRSGNLETITEIAAK